jgi:20S proteasome subunit beta 2
MVRFVRIDERNSDETSDKSLPFDFENTSRNATLITLGEGFKGPKFTKTGTTIVGAVFNGGIVLGADTRATNGPLVADKNCEKIHFMAPNVMCCGAGTAADTEKVTAMVSAKLTLERLSTGKQTRVRSCLTRLKQHLYRYQGHVSAALVLGGYDVHGPYLGTVAPHGSTDRLPYVSMGSGSLAAMAILESRYKDGMTEEECKTLIHDAIAAGIWNDLGSGSNVDLCVMRKDGTEMLRNIDMPNEKKFTRERPIQFPKGTTTILKEDIRKLIVEETVVVPSGRAMKVD